MLSKIARVPNMFFIFFPLFKALNVSPQRTALMFVVPDLKGQMEMDCQLPNGTCLSIHGSDKYRPTPGSVNETWEKYKYQHILAQRKKVIIIYVYIFFLRIIDHYVERIDYCRIYVVRFAGRPMWRSPTCIT